jgi:hypothetical protein
MNGFAMTPFRYLVKFLQDYTVPGAGRHDLHMLNPLRVIEVKKKSTGESVEGAEGSYMKIRSKYVDKVKHSSSLDTPAACCAVSNTCFSCVIATQLSDDALPWR